MDVQALTKQISDLAQKGAGDIQEADRAALLGSLYKLRDAVENPFEKIVRIMFDPCDAAALRLAVDMGFFETAAQKGGPTTVREFAEKKKADPTLVRRILRLLASISFFEITDVDTFAPTPFAYACTSPPLNAAIIHFSTGLSTVTSLPEYFEEKAYQNPVDADDGPWQFVHNEGERWWDWYRKSPRLSQAFNSVMEAQNQWARGAEDWFEIYPVEEKLKLGKGEEERPLLVDIGGNVGHELVLFHKRFPNLPGRLILEDLPHVIESAKDLPPAIEPTPYNFFTPQHKALRGAKVYYNRTVLHDWPDKQAREILTHIKDAMAPDSILLINEIVVEEKGVAHLEAQLDLRMMVHCASGERTEEQWRTLLDSCGLEIRKLWRNSQKAEGKLCLIETVLKQ